MSLYTAKYLTSAHTVSGNTKLPAQTRGLPAHTPEVAGTESTLPGDGRLCLDTGTLAHRLAPPAVSWLVPYGNPGTEHRAGKRCLCRCCLCRSHFPFTNPAGRQGAGTASAQGHLGITRLPCWRETPWATPHAAAASKFRKGKCQMLSVQLACQDLPLRCWQSCL